MARFANGKTLHGHGGRRVINLVRSGSWEAPVSPSHWCSSVYYSSCSHGVGSNS